MFGTARVNSSEESKRTSQVENKKDFDKYFKELSDLVKIKLDNTHLSALNDVAEIYRIYYSSPVTKTSESSDPTISGSIYSKEDLDEYKEAANKQLQNCETAIIKLTNAFPVADKSQATSLSQQLIKTIQDLKQFFLNHLENHNNHLRVASPSNRG